VEDRAQRSETDYRSVLFREYHTRTSILDPDERTKLAWFREYVRANYLRHLASVDRQHGQVLDLGCNRGYLLAALASEGFDCLAGVDLSAGEIDEARRIVPSADLTFRDATDYLASHNATFDAIVAKAIVEHVPKDDVLPFVRAIRRGLKPGGIALIDVPNMDWLFASHERYLDFTHESGFTKESLYQVVGSVFNDVEVVPIDNIPPANRFSRRAIARTIIGLVLRWADPEGASGPLWSRTMVAVAHAPGSSDERRVD
jgi:SAM-dependent methyltransferase